MFQKIISFIFICLFLVCCAGGAVAQEEDPALSSEYLTDALKAEQSGGTKISDIKLPNIFEVIIRFLFALLILIGCIFIVSFFYSRFFNARFSLKQNTLINVIEHRFLDAKRAVYLIDVAGKMLVVGSSTEGMNLLSEITDKEQIETIHELAALKTNQYRSADFSKVLSGVAGGPTTEKQYKEKPPGSEALSAGIQSIRTKIDKIKKIINER
jgi:flagellar biogenesis protein FliO